MQAKGHSPTSIFSPIHLYVSMHEWVERERNIRYVQYLKGSRSYFVVGNLILRIFWSNKYAPLDRIIVYDKGFGDWIVKPDPLTKGYLRVEIEDMEDSMKRDIRVRTVAKLVPLDTLK